MAKPAPQANSLLTPTITQAVVTRMVKGFAGIELRDTGGETLGVTKIVEAKRNGLLIDVGGQKLMIGVQPCR